MDAVDKTSLLSSSSSRSEKLMQYEMKLNLKKKKQKNKDIFGQYLSKLLENYWHFLSSATSPVAIKIKHLYD